MASFTKRVSGDRFGCAVRRRSAWRRHQDVIYWQLEPMINVSAWLAIDDVDEENSCVQLIPGSHWQTIPHRASPGDVHQDFTLAADPAYYREDTAVSTAMRVTTPQVKVRQPGHDRLILLGGCDEYGYNTPAPP